MKDKSKSSDHARQRRSRRKAFRPRELIDAAMVLFAEKGLSATRIDEIAAKAGVSKGLVYLYFKSKEELFDAVFQKNVLPALEQSELLIEQSNKASADLLRELLLYWSHVHGLAPAGGIFRLIISEAFSYSIVVHSYSDQVLERCLRLVEIILSQGIETGEFRAFDVRLLSRIVLAPIIVREIGCRMDDSPVAKAGASDGFWRHHLDLIFQGLSLIQSDSSSVHTV